MKAIFYIYFVLTKDELGKAGMYNCVLNVNENEFKVKKILIIK